jgi:putative redox protein
MDAKIIHVKGISFIGKANSNHWVSMDGPLELQGNNAGARPKELVLLGLGGCTASDVASILIKMREPLQKFEIDLHAEDATEHPKVFTRIHISYKFWGQNLNRGNIEKAIDLSVNKYCSVSAMLMKAVEITHSYEINPA